LYFVAPTGIFIFNSLPSVTGILDDKFGVRILTIVGSLSLLGSQLLIYFFQNFILLIISYALFGFCGSLTYFQSLKNCWKYFPNKKGLITGIIFSSFGLSAFIFTTIGDAVGDFKLYLKIFIICIIAMGTLSSLLSFPYKKEEEYLDNLAMVPNEDNFEEQNSDKENNDKEKKEENHYSVQLKNENNNNEKEENESLTLKESLLSKDFFLCLTIASCTLIFGFLLTNTYRPYGELAFVGENKDKEIKTLSKVFTLLNTFSRLLWGYISDKIRFKILYPIVCINQLICGSLIYLSSFNIVSYYIVVNLAVLSFSGHVILFPTLIHTKFGVENSVYLLGICGIFIGAVALVGPIITLFALPNIKDIYVNGKIDYDELNKIKKKYLMIYLIGVAPTIISLIISIFIKVQQKQKQETKKVDDNYDDDEEEDLTNKKETVTGVELNKKK
jgi:OFA family oxalate/formate antiporter-like MFS transporter